MSENETPAPSNFIRKIISEDLRSTATVLEAVDVIVNGIEQGAFPQHPEPTTRSQWVSCEYCDPDGLGVAEAERRFLRKATDPALEDYVGLARPSLLAAPTLDIGDEA